MQFGFVALNVGIMLLSAVPGFVFAKTKFMKAESISTLAKLLLYFCQPCLSIYSFQKVQYSKELFLNMLLFFAISFCIQNLVLIILKITYSKKSEDARFKVATVAPVLGNVGFLGIPLLEALLPQNPEVIAYAATFIIGMNITSWTFGAFVLTGDKSFIKPKKIFLNPPVLTLFITLPLFFTKTSLPDVLLNFVTIPAKFSTPLCMIILGMRFATTNLKEMFTSPTVYISTILKLIIFPLFTFLLTYWLPIDYSMKVTIFILCACPTASVVLSLAEISNTGGQKYAAYTILMTTICCSITIPLLLMIL